eukprot:PhM_4_TR6519/c0_g1_i1/m.35378
MRTANNCESMSVRTNAMGQEPTTVRCLPVPLPGRLGCVLVDVRVGDLTKERDLDVLVNAANGRLSNAGGLAAAIARAGAPFVQDACDKFMETMTVASGLDELPTGTAVMLPAGAVLRKANNLTRGIVHVVGPIWDDGLSEPVQRGLLQQCYENTFREAVSKLSAPTTMTLALPALSTGIFGFPFETCAHAFAAAVVNFFKKEFPALYARTKRGPIKRQRQEQDNCHLTLRLTLFDEDVAKTFVDILVRELLPPPPKKKR